MLILGTKINDTIHIGTGSLVLTSISRIKRIAYANLAIDGQTLELALPYRVKVRFNNLVFMLLNISGYQAQIGIEAPKDVTILRDKVLQRQK